MTGNEAIERILCMISNKRENIKKIQEEIFILEEIRLVILKTQAKTHEFDNEDDLKKAMLLNFNPYDTFICKKE
jgi:hypothetical protein